MARERIKRGEEPGEFLRAFRIGWLARVKWTLAGTTLSAFVFLFLVFIVQGYIGTYDLAFAAFFSSVFTIPIFFAMANVGSVYLTNRVTTEGLGLYDFWGRYHFARWEDLEDIRRHVLMVIVGVPHLRTMMRDGKVVYLPLCLQDQRAYNLAIFERVKKNHPLRVALERYSYPEDVPRSPKP